MYHWSGLVTVPLRDTLIAFRRLPTGFLKSSARSVTSMLSFLQHEDILVVGKAFTFATIAVFWGLMRFLYEIMWDGRQTPKTASLGFVVISYSPKTSTFQPLPCAIVFFCLFVCFWQWHPLWRCARKSSVSSYNFLLSPSTMFASMSLSQSLIDVTSGKFHVSSYTS